MKTLNLTLATLVAVVAFTGQALADSFSSLNAGENITISDTIWNSTYNGGSPALGRGGEDNETERLVNGTNTYTGQKWDFEGMFWNNSTNKLTLIAGWDFANGVVHGGPNVQVGDLFMGSWGSLANNSNPAAGKLFSANEVLAFSRDTTNDNTNNSLKSSGGTYNKVTGNFTTNGTTDVSQSNPFSYKANGTVVSDASFKYSIGSVTGSGFSSWELPADTGHYFMQIEGLTFAEIAGDIMHITLACGNDGGAGNVPVPEPGTMMLLGFGMLGLAVYGKRRMNKEA